MKNPFAITQISNKVWGRGVRTFFDSPLKYANFFFHWVMDFFFSRALQVNVKDEL